MKKMTTSKEIGKIFKEEREKQDLTRHEASLQSRIHSGVIKDIENGIFDKMGKLYIKSFVKKYSVFLEMDTESIMGKYAEVAEDIPQKSFTLSLENKEENEDLFKKGITRKAQVIFAATLSIVLVVLIFILLGMMRSRLGGNEADRPVKKAASSAGAKKAAPKRSVSKGTVKFSLEANGEVWVKVKYGDKTLFTGIMKKGDSKVWTEKGVFTVWTGKAERLKLKVNGKNVEDIGKGVLKNIYVSAEGVRKGDSWVTRLK